MSKGIRVKGKSSHGRRPRRQSLAQIRTRTPAQIQQFVNMSKRRWSAKPAKIAAAEAAAARSAATQNAYHDPPKPSFCSVPMLAVHAHAHFTAAEAQAMVDQARKDWAAEDARYRAENAMSLAATHDTECNAPPSTRAQPSTRVIVAPVLSPPRARLQSQFAPPPVATQPSSFFHFHDGGSYNSGTTTGSGSTVRVPGPDDDMSTTDNGFVDSAMRNLQNMLGHTYTVATGVGVDRVFADAPAECELPRDVSDFEWRVSSCTTTDEAFWRGEELAIRKRRARFDKPWERTIFFWRHTESELNNAARWGTLGAIAIFQKAHHTHNAQLLARERHRVQHLCSENICSGTGINDGSACGVAFDVKDANRMPMLWPSVLQPLAYKACPYVMQRRWMCGTCALRLYQLTEPYGVFRPWEYQCGRRI